jgi:hypothetical protein
MMDVYQVKASDCSFPALKASPNNGDQKEYILCLADKPIIQWRDFLQHSIIRELEIGVSCPRVMRVASDGNFVIGDDEGTIWNVKENGLTLNKIKVFDGSFAGI